MGDLKAIESTRKSGDEPFHRDGNPLPIRLLSFWQWSASELVDNALRGTLAEYIVASALDRTNRTRLEWDSHDIETKNGIKVEVKSSAYVQRWKQEKLSPIKFGIQPAKGWDAKENTYSDTRMRNSDVYIFCVLAHKSKSTIDPLNVAQWDFYVLATETLNSKLGTQATLALSSLLKLNPLETKYDGIAAAVDQVLADE